MAPLRMRQAFLEAPGQLVLRRVEVPRPGPGQVVVRVRAALTCGTDLKTYRRGHARLPVPGPFGHEAAGEVVEAGPGAGSWQPGDAVVWLPTAPCGECPECARGRENLCRRLFEPDRLALGTYADFVLLPAPVVARHLFPAPAGVPARVAALLEPLACAVRGARRLGPAGDVLLVGGGPMALLLALALRRHGARTVTLVSRRPGVAGVARFLGATHVVEGPVHQQVPELRSLRPGGFEAVVECTGSPEVWELAPALARPGGRVLFFGGLAAGTRVAFDAYRLHYEEVDLVGAFHYTTEDARAAYALLGEEAGRLEALVAGERPLSAVADLFRRLDREGHGLKVAVVPDGEG